MRVGFSPTSVISTSELGSDAAAAAQNAAAEQSPRDAQGGAGEALPAGDADTAIILLDLDAECLECAFGVVPGRRRLLYKRVSVGVKTGQEDRTLDLRTRNLRHISDPVQRTAAGS